MKKLALMLFSVVWPCVWAGAAAPQADPIAGDGFEATPTDMSQHDTRREIAELLAIAEYKKAAGDYALASDAVRKCLALNPGHPRATEIARDIEWLSRDRVKWFGIGSIYDWTREDAGGYRAFANWTFEDAKCRYRFALMPAFVPFQLRRFWILFGGGRLVFL